MSQSDFQTPGLGLLCKLGSIARHAEEAIGPHGHERDREAINALLGDPDVKAWLAEMDERALLPVMRSSR